jgi:hypothetical protein
MTKTEFNENYGSPGYNSKVLTCLSPSTNTPNFIKSETTELTASEFFPSVASNATRVIT